MKTVIKDISYHEVIATRSTYPLHCGKWADKRAVFPHVDRQI